MVCLLKKEHSYYDICFMDKDEIEKRRRAGGWADIGTEADGAIMETFEINGKLLIIKERSIYEFGFADQYDPQRLNQHLPNNIQKLVASQGTESEIVCRTFLTAQRLFKSDRLIEGIEIERALNITLEALQDFIALESGINDYIQEETAVSDAYNQRRQTKGSYALPSVPDVTTRCKTIFQKADHITQALMEVVTKFYPSWNLNKQSHYTTFHTLLVSNYGEQDEFAQYIEKALPFIKALRAIRNSLDHRLPYVTVKDFELQPDGSILAPTIELQSYQDSELERTSLSEFLKLCLHNLVAFYEFTITNLCGKNLRPKAGFPNTLKFIPEDRRHNKHIRYSYWLPLGEGGYFDQGS